MLVRELLKCSFLYTDDVVVLADSVDEIQSAADAWQRGMRYNGMVINTQRDKTELMAVSRNIEEYDVCMLQDRINQTKNYKYLGLDISEMNLEECEISNMIAK